MEVKRGNMMEERERETRNWEWEFELCSVLGWRGGCDLCETIFVHLVDLRVLCKLHGWLENSARKLKSAICRWKMVTIGSTRFEKKRVNESWEKVVCFCVNDIWRPARHVHRTAVEGAGGWEGWIVDSALWKYRKFGNFIMEQSKHAFHIIKQSKKCRPLTYATWPTPKLCLFSTQPAQPTGEQKLCFSINYPIFWISFIRALKTLLCFFRRSYCASMNIYFKTNKSRSVPQIQNSFAIALSKKSSLTFPEHEQNICFWHGIKIEQSPSNILSASRK